MNAEQLKLIQGHRIALANGADRARLAYLETSAYMERLQREGAQMTPDARDGMAAWDNRTREFCRRVCGDQGEG